MIPTRPDRPILLILSQNIQLGLFKAVFSPFFDFKFYQKNGKNGITNLDTPVHQNRLVDLTFKSGLNVFTKQNGSIYFSMFYLRKVYSYE